MQETICARVNARLLTKADRLFTGTVEGRIIEILQNARRAGGTTVKITNHNGLVTVRDNGSGIEDFQKLLDLGGSGWDEQLERGEDPAGVGLFSLAPREVTIVSGHRQAVIDAEGWTGKPVEVTEADKAVSGTLLRFKDDKPWDFDTVEKHAVFCGMTVVVDGKRCHATPFCSDAAVHYQTPGCRIEITNEISNYHQKWLLTWYTGKILVNFHGQVVQLDCWPAKNRNRLAILVDITQDTAIRLMLPARTCLIENEAYEQLKSAIEKEFYRYWQRQKSHSLYHDEYLRARELGIELPEAEPQFHVGLITDEYDQAVQMAMTRKFELKDGYLYPDDETIKEHCETNAHLLAATGKLKDTPFVPVTIHSGYMGYSWSNLPRVTKVEVIRGKELLRHSIACVDIACFGKLEIRVETSDGKAFSSEVPIAVIDQPPAIEGSRHTDLVCVTRAARDQLTSDNIWYHMGGFNDEGDSYDTQLWQFEKLLDEFWNELIGPHESLRQKLLDDMACLYDEWQKAVITEDGRLEIHFKDGSCREVRPGA